MTLTIRKLLVSFVSIVVLGAGWYFFAPSALGGTSDYVVVYGTSMHPHYHAGDLVIVRKSTSFHVGEIVAYRNASLGNRAVLHRIIGIDGNQYTFKGDNNDFVDSYHPTRAQLIGKMWLHVPALGRYLLWARSPRHLPLAGAGLLILLLSLFGGAETQRRRRRRGTEAPPALRPKTSGANAFNGPAGNVVLAGGVALLAFAGLALLGFTRPVSHQASQNGLYTQTGHFSYAGEAPAGAAVYGGTSATTGQPLFVALVHSARFRFAYRFDSNAPHSVAGKIGLAVQLTANDGWKRTIRLADPQPFTGDRGVVTGTLDLRRLEKVLATVASLSNINVGTYTVTLKPTVDVHGLAGGNAVKQTWSPTLGFLLDTYQLQLEPGGAAGPSSSTDLTQSTSGAGVIEQPNQISLLRLHVSVTTARSVGLLGGAVALLALLGGLLYGRRHRAPDEATEIERRFGDYIVAVKELPSGWSLPVVEVTSFDGLAKIAEQGVRMVLRLDEGAACTYFVEDDGFIYVYRPEASTPPGSSDPVASDDLDVDVDELAQALDALRIAQDR